jgi:hypothetical protein
VPVHAAFPPGIPFPLVRRLLDNYRCVAYYFYMNICSYDKLFTAELPESESVPNRAPGAWNTLGGDRKGGPSHFPGRKAWNPYR